MKRRRKKRRAPRKKHNGAVLFIMWLTPGVPPPGPFG